MNGLGVAIVTTPGVMTDRKARHRGRRRSAVLRGLRRNSDVAYRKNGCVPAGVDVKIGDEQITVKGSGGELKLATNPLVKVAANGANLSFVPADESREANAMSGTMRQLVNNMVVGVSKGFEKKLNLVGVGFRAQAQGNKLNLSIGFRTPSTSTCRPASRSRPRRRPKS
jgi:ribosomal protein L6P/L9E